MKKINSLIVLGIALGSIGANAGVNLKNGNFYTSFTDAVVHGVGQKLKMTRTYNSKSTHNGWFGFGWGTKFETKLTKSADGCVFIQEYGGGSKTRFCPKNAVDPGPATDKIIEAMRSRSGLTEVAAKNLKQKLLSNASLRHAYAKNFNVQSKIASGTELFSNDRGIQAIKVEKDGYVRTSNDGQTEYFDSEGKLTKVKDKNNYYVELAYKKDKLYSLKDSFAKQLFFEWHSNGKVKKMWSVGDKKAEFKYEGIDLVYSKDIQGNEYGFSYDKSHNLTSVIYNPNRSKDEPLDAMKMVYEDKTGFVTSVIDRNNESTSYKYGANSKNPDDHYWTEVTKVGFNGKPVTNKYEYEIKTKPDGAKYTYRILTNISGIKTETIYSECCGLPLKIARGKHVTNFEYNEDGLLTKKASTKGDFVKIEYKKDINKIAKVTNSDGWTSFDYDKKGNLVKAINSKGKAVLLIYDNKGKISKMVDRNKSTKKTRTLAFQYNSIGKPVIIAMDNVGKINVQYDNYGDIKRVDSEAGHKMALQVTQAFQNLLAIVKPAGVNLNM